MKAILLQSYGGADQFVLGDAAKPKAGPGEVLINLKASCVNPYDIMVRKGLMAKVRQLELPAILGGDGAGVVEAVGAGVTRFKAGDRVIADFATNGKGAHAEYGVAPEGSVAHLPDALSFEEGAVLPKAGLASRGALKRIGVKAGDRVLVAGALGSVGRAAYQYLKEIGAVPVAGVRAERMEDARAAFGGEVIDIGVMPEKPSFPFAISMVAAVSANVVAHVLDGGKIAAIARPPEGVNADNRVEIQVGSHQPDAEELQKTADAAARGDLDIPVAATFSLKDLADAHKAFEAGAQGKIVLTHG